MLWQHIRASHTKQCFYVCVKEPHSGSTLHSPCLMRELGLCHAAAYRNPPVISNLDLCFKVQMVLNCCFTTMSDGKHLGSSSKRNFLKKCKRSLFCMVLVLCFGVNVNNYPRFLVHFNISFSVYPCIALEF